MQTSYLNGPQDAPAGGLPAYAAHPPAVPGAHTVHAAVRLRRKRGVLRALPEVWQGRNTGPAPRPLHQGRRVRWVEVDEIEKDVSNIVPTMDNPSTEHPKNNDF